MTTTNANKLRAKKLLAIYAVVIGTASLVIWLTLTSGQTVVTQTKKLTDYRIPELREISMLQIAMSDRAIQLYLYYATFNTQEWEEQDALLTQRVTSHLEALKKLRLVDIESKKLLTLIATFSQSATLFNQEMLKLDTRDWDMLRAHLSTAKMALNEITSLLNEWSEKINNTAQESGLTALDQVNQLTKLQLGFSITVMLISAFVLIALYARLKDQDDLYRLAYFDELTSLPNRQRLEDDLEEILATNPNTKGALFIVQIERIKIIASTYGHAIADQLIIQIARRMTNKQVTANMQIYRINTDSFAIISQQSCELLTALDTAKNLSSVMESSITLGTRSLSAKLSIGIALFANQQDTAARIMRNAVAALSVRKQSGDIHVFEPRMTEESETWLSTESALRAALEHSEFELHYQPKVCAKTQTTMSSEALIRWRRDGNLISPAQFIPVAEESGLIVPIGHWVLLEACRQWQVWRSKGLLQLPIAVNISAQQFQDPAFLAQVENALKQYEVPPAMIELEITEAVAANDPESAVAMMMKLKNLGVTLAIDDFGTGYSSLSYLKRFPIDTLKIDIAFVRNINTSAHDQAIATMILALGKQLNLKVVAEGVETQDQQFLLAALGCDILQGYLFSKPIPAAQFAERINTI